MILRDLAAVTGGRYVRQFMVFAVASAILQAVVVLLLFPLLQRQWTGHLRDAMPWVLGFVAATAGMWVLDLIAGRYGLHAGMATMDALCEAATPAVRNLPLGQMNRRRVKAYEKLIATGGTEFSSGVILVITVVVTAFAFSIALALGLAVTVSPLIGTVVGLSAVLLGLSLWGSGKIEEGADQRYHAANADLEDRLVEFAWLQPTLRTNGRTAEGAEHVEKDIKEAHSRTKRLLGWQIPGEILFNQVLQIVLIGLAAVTWYEYQAGTLNSVSAAIMIVVALRMIEHITAVNMLSSAVHGTARDLRKIRELQAYAALDKQAKPNPDAPAPRVALKNVTAGYGEALFDTARATARGNVIENLNLTLPAGEITVVMGPSGCGKSTLLKLVSGLLDPLEGDVLIDGEPLTAVARRARSTVVFQDTELAAGTVGHNLLTVNPQLSEEEQRELLRTVHLDIALDTNVGELGSQLSGGQRQRLGMARALAKPGADILLIDEATSALDNVNEQLLWQTVKELRGKYTIFIITHRPAALQIADHVVRVDSQMTVL